MPGKPEPSRITLALDARGLYGPEVDVACGAVEPAVDNWEAGTEIPTPEQIELLAKLTDFPIEWFYAPPIEKPDPSTIFICGPARHNRKPSPRQVDPAITRPTVRRTTSTEPDRDFVTVSRAREVREQIEAEGDHRPTTHAEHTAAALPGICARCGATPDQGACYIPARLCGRG